MMNAILILRRLFELDVRAIGVFRLAIGIFAVLDLVGRAMMGMEWYISSDQYPDNAWVLTEDTPHKSPIHQVLFYRGSYAFECSWFAVHAVVALTFTLGWWTDITSIALWFMTIVLHGRQEQFHDGSDKLFANLMLWAIFLPIGEAFVFRLPPPSSSSSSSRWWRLELVRSCGPYRTALTCGTAGVVLQFCSLYAGVVIMRYYRGRDWWPSSGTLLYYAIHAGFASTKFAAIIGQYPWVTYAMTVSAVFAEASLPLLVFFTTSTSRSRLLVVVVGVLVQAGIQMLFYLPQFAAISVIASIPMLPTPVLDDWLGKSKSETTLTEGGGRRGCNDVSSAATASSSSGGGSGVAGAGFAAGAPTVAAGGIFLLPAPLPGFKSSISSTETAAERRMQRIAGGRISRCLSLFCLVYMIHLFLADTVHLFRPIDGGDIGQGIRFVQGFDMFTARNEARTWPIVLATGTAATASGAAAAAGGRKGGVKVRYDLLELERNGVGSIAPALSKAEVEAQFLVGKKCLTCGFFGWRYERAFCNTGKNRPISANMGLAQKAKAYCTMFRAYANAGAFPDLDRSKPITINSYTARKQVVDADWSKAVFEAVPPNYRETTMKQAVVASGAAQCSLA